MSPKPNAPQLDSIRFIGSKRASILKRSGILSVSDFAKADPVYLSRLLGPPLTPKLVGELQQSISETPRRRHSFLKIIIAIASFVSFVAAIATILSAWPQLLAFFQTRSLSVAFFPTECNTTQQCGSNITVSKDTIQIIHIGIPYQSIKTHVSKHLCVKIPFVVKLNSPNVLPEAKLSLSIESSSHKPVSIFKNSGYPLLELDENACRFADMFFGQRYSEMETTRTSLRANGFKKYLYTFKNAIPDQIAALHVVANEIPGSFIINNYTGKAPYKEDDGDLSEFTEGDLLTLSYAPIKIKLRQQISDTQSEIGEIYLHLHYIKIDADLYAQSLILDQYESKHTNAPAHPKISITKKAFVIPTIMLSPQEAIPSLIEHAKEIEAKAGDDGNFVDPKDAAMAQRQSSPFYYAIPEKVQTSFYADPKIPKIAEKMTIRSPIDQDDKIEMKITEYNDLRNSVRTDLIMQRQFPHQYKKYLLEQ